MAVERHDLNVQEALDIALETARLHRLDRLVGVEQRVQLRVVNALHKHEQHQQRSDQCAQTTYEYNDETQKHRATSNGFDSTRLSNDKVQVAGKPRNSRGAESPRNGWRAACSA